MGATTQHKKSERCKFKKSNNIPSKDGTTQ